MAGELPSEKVPGAENQQERAKEILGSAYQPQEVEAILASVGEGALDALDGVRTSTNPVQRRKYLNEWYRQFKTKE